MGRPKRPFNGVEDINPSDDPWLMGALPGVVGTRQRRRWEASRHWTYKTTNGVNDPLTYLHVLTVIAAIDPNIELRTNRLVEYLDVAVDQFNWDVITVGKVLANLQESFEDVLGEKSGILERGKDYRGTFYRIHHNPETAALYFRLREDLMKLVEIEKAARATNQKTTRIDNPLLECPSVRTNFAQIA